MRVLAVDTTTAMGSIGLLRGGAVLEERELLGPDGFAQLLLPAIGELLDRHGWTLADVDLFAAASGPGSFTGVRVGLTAIKGLAEASGRPAQAISNLRALAGFGAGEVRVPLLHARRGEVFGGWYDAELRPQRPEWVGSLSELKCPADAAVVTQESWAELEASGLTWQRAPRSLAAMVGRLAAQDGGVDPAAIDANYVRRSDADGRWHDA